MAGGEDGDQGIDGRGKMGGGDEAGVVRCRGLEGGDARAYLGTVHPAGERFDVDVEVLGDVDEGTPGGGQVGEDGGGLVGGGLEMEWCRDHGMVNVRMIAAKSIGFCTDMPPLL